MNVNSRQLVERLHDEMADSVEEEMELELDDDRLADLLAEGPTKLGTTALIGNSISRNCWGCNASSSSCRTGFSVKS